MAELGETSKACQVDFDSCHAAALAWLSDSANVSSEWHLLWADSEERQLVLEHKTTGVNFSISILSDKGHGSRQECFKIRSDADSTWSYLKECKGSSIEECLAQSIAALRPLVDDTKLSDDEDDNMYDYYGGLDDEQDFMETESSSKSNPVPHALTIPSGTQRNPSDSTDTESDAKMYTKSGSSMAVHRLLSDLKMFKKSSGTSGIEGSPRGDNLFIWDVKLTDFESDSVLGRDLARYAQRYNQKPEVVLEMTFPQDYPISPPFIRIIRPRFKFLTGHVTIGGSICMELLTKSGWRPTNDIESILVQVRAAILSDPKAGLDDMSNANREYTIQEAEKAFHRMTQTYGWNK